MSKHNYNKYSKPKIEVEKPIIRETIEIIPEEPKELSGTVIGCEKLNVREHPDRDAEVLCVINADTTLIVTGVNYGLWYKICTVEGIEGYCMKKFIEVK